jgi:hypothetical protein
MVKSDLVMTLEQTKMDYVCKKRHVKSKDGFKKLRTQEISNISISNIA